MKSPSPINGLRVFSSLVSLAKSLIKPGLISMSADTPVQSSPSHRVRRRGLIALLLIILVPALLFSAWTWITLSYSYSTGERAGYIQKVSQKGWLCKTWEGELAMANLPGAMPEIFKFSVRNDSVAHLLEKNIGKRVTIDYEQHRGVPASCFADTQYYITNVRPNQQ